MSRAGILLIAVLGAFGLSIAIAGGLLGGGSSGSGLLATAVAQEAGTNPPPVVGDLLDCPPSGPGPEDVRARFDIDGNTFEVTGALRSFDGVTMVVAGPSGDVTATLAASFELKGDFSPGQPVSATGTVADDGSKTVDKAESACLGVGVVDCVVGGDPRLRLKLEGGVFQLTGKLDSLSATGLSVAGPGLLVEANIDSATRLPSGLKAGDTVTVKGIVLDTKALQAQDVVLACGGNPGALVAASPPARRAASDNCKGASEERGKSRAKVKDGKVSIQNGTVLSSDGNTMRISTSGGPLTVKVNHKTQVHGDLASAEVVSVEGSLQDDGSVLAAQVTVDCSNAKGEHGKRCNEQDANRGHGNDCDHNDEDNPGHGRGGHGAD